MLPTAGAGSVDIDHHTCFIQFYLHKGAIRDALGFLPLFRQRKDFLAIIGLELDILFSMPTWMSLPVTS